VDAAEVNSQEELSEKFGSKTLAEMAMYRVYSEGEQMKTGRIGATNTQYVPPASHELAWSD